MIDLEKEAEEYAKESNKHETSDYTYSQEDLIKGSKIDFIAGINSNYAKQQVIKGKIEVLEDVFDHSFDPYVKHKLDELKQLETPKI